MLWCIGSVAQIGSVEGNLVPTDNTVYYCIEDNPGEKRHSDYRTESSGNGTSSDTG